MKPDWRPFMPGDKRFRFRHGVMWLLYLWLLTLNLEMLLDARQSSGLTLLPAVVLSWLAVFTAGACIGPWLDGANRSRLFRLALIATALLSCVLGVWMLWHYVVFLLVGLVTLFQRPFELISLALFGERLMVLLLALVTFAAFAWLSLRVIRVLLSGEPTANLEHVLGNQPLSKRLPPRRPEPELVGPLPQVDLGCTIHSKSSHLYPPPKVLFARSFVGPPKPPDKPGKQRYLCRPRELEPKTDAIYRHVGPPVLQGMGFTRGNAAQKREKCQSLGWAAFEWIFRTEPSLEELVMALEALPHLASSIDDEDAAEARAWISRLADHPGQYERAIPYREIADLVTSETIRVADVALQTLFAWDGERKKLRAPPTNI